METLIALAAGALLIALRLRATADGLLLPDGRIKNGGRA